MFIQKSKKYKEVFNFEDYKNEVLLLTICQAELDVPDGHEFFSLNPYVTVFLNNQINLDVKKTPVCHSGGFFPQWNWNN
jgi:hypothetical protein